MSSGFGGGRLDRRTSAAVAGFVAVLLVAVLSALLARGTPGSSGSPDPSDPSGRSGTSGTASPGGTDPVSGLPWVAEDALPEEARATLALIDAGGPFPYDRDGVVFHNFEGLLPEHADGYYHEYTVPTPGSADRGARRIIAGGPGELYWTADHYASFARIARAGP